MQILFFPPLSHILSHISTLFSHILFPAHLPLKPAGKPLQTAPETPENSPRKTSQKTLSASPPPRKEKRKTPRKAFISGLSKWFGGGRNPKREKKRTKKSQRLFDVWERFRAEGRKTEREGEEKSLAGRKTPHKALIFTYFLFRHRKN